MSFDVRPLTDQDYDNTLTKWWKQWRWEAPGRDFLPNGGRGGIMVSKDGVDICAGYIYFTNSKAVWIEFIVSNIEYKELDRKGAIKFLIDTLSEYGKENGAKYAYVSLRNEALINKYIECGFQKGSVGCTELVKVL